MYSWKSLDCVTGDCKLGMDQTQADGVKMFIFCSQISPLIAHQGMKINTQIKKAKMNGDVSSTWYNRNLTLCVWSTLV